MKKKTCEWSVLKGKPITSANILNVHETQQKTTTTTPTSTKRKKNNRNGLLAIAALYTMIIS